MIVETRVGSIRNASRSRMAQLLFDICWDPCDVTWGAGSGRVQQKSLMKGQALFKNNFPQNRATTQAIVWDFVGPEIEEGTVEVIRRPILASSV